jgi:nucleoside-diphosphate-sugar epimerase
MSNILVTGGAGFVGSAIAEKLMEDPNNFVVIVDDLSTGYKENLPSTTLSNWRFVKGDVNVYRDIAEIMLSTSFDYVFHYAALVGVQRTQDNPVAVLDDITGFKNILDLSKNTGVKRFFFSSSSEVYGEPVELPQHEETTPLNSRVPYAVVKNVGESFVKSYQKEFGLDYTIFRFFNTFGPKQSSDFVMSKFINKALNNEDITIYGDGNQTRTFCFVKDNVDTCYNTLINMDCINDVINVGGQHEVTILELASMIIEETNSMSKIVHLPALEDGDMTRRCPDNSKMRAVLGRDLIPVREGIKIVLNSDRFKK